MPLTPEREKEIEAHVVALGRRVSRGTDRSGGMGCLAWFIALPLIIWLGYSTATWIGILVAIGAAVAVLALAVQYDEWLVRRCSDEVLRTYAAGTEELAFAMRVVSELSGNGPGLQKFKEATRHPGVARVRTDESPSLPVAVSAPELAPAPEKKAPPSRIIPLEPFDPSEERDERD